jgi:Ca2+-binding RTX toxin-like protein
VGGSVTVGGGNHTIHVHGNETISILAGGNDTIDANKPGAHAVVYGPGGPFGTYGSATITGGSLEVGSTGYTLQITASGGQATIQGGIYPEQMHGGTGSTTMLGGFGPDTFFGGAGSSLMQGGFGPDSFVGGQGSDTMIAGFGNDTMVGGHKGAGGDVFAFTGGSFGHDVVKNFISGQDQLYLDGHTLSYLESHHDITTKNGNTTIHLGATTIELQGVTHLSSSDITTHKP